MDKDAKTNFFDLKSTNFPQAMKFCFNFSKIVLSCFTNFQVSSGFEWSTGARLSSTVSVKDIRFYKQNSMQKLVFFAINHG